MACGKPVLSTPLKGTVELLPNENYGIVYSQLDDFISSIEKLLQNKAQSRQVRRKWVFLR